MIAGGACFLLAIGCYVYAEYLVQNRVPELEQLFEQSIAACGGKAGDPVCIRTAGEKHVTRFAENKTSIKTFIWTLPIFLISSATILGYLGLIIWGIQQPASRRPMVAISAMGILIQTILFIWILVMRYTGLG